MSIKMNKVNRNMNVWIAATAMLTIGFVLASNANGAIRRVCLESISDNGTRIMTTSACKVDAPKPRI